MDDVCRMSKRATPSGSAAGAADLISGLGDDVLVHILGLLPDAGDAVRTGALSRRWRGLWTRLPALRFASTSRPLSFSGDTGGVRRFASFVKKAIALRAAETDPAIQHLAISFVTPPHKPLPRRSVVKAARGCIGDAVRHDVKSLALELRHAGRERRDNRGNNASEKQLGVKILDGLPRSAKMETMRLALGGARVMLPPAGATAPAFASLSDLTLESMEFAVDSGHLLTDLLSSACCPRLQKLRLRDLAFDFEIRGLQLQNRLLLEAEALLELSWEKIVRGPKILRLRTPNLRVLRTVDCGFDELAISAPKLEELSFLGCGQPERITGIIDGGLPCVRSLRVGLTSHAFNFDEGHDHEYYDEDNNGATFRLLSCCTAVACLDVDLYVLMKEYRSVHTTEGRIPQLPQVTSLTIHVRLRELHSVGSGMAADILAQCSNLKYLRTCCTFKMDNEMKSPFFCDQLDSFKSDVVYCLPHLKEVEFMGLAGTECELWFVQSMLASTTQLDKVAISFDPKSSLENRIHAFECITPLQEYGMWICCQEPYLSLEWKPSLRV